MEQSRFFRFVWRFNALLFALIGIVAVGMLGWSFLPQQHWWPAPPEGHFAPVPEGAEKDNTYRLARLEVSLVGQAIFQLGRWDGAPSNYGLQAIRPRGSSEYDGPNTVNLMAIDEASGAGHWLFQGYKREILSEDAITARGPDGTINIALVIHTIDADTDKDGALTDKDTQSLYVYWPGADLAVKLIDVDYLLSHEQAGETRYLVVYERGKQAVAATYNLPDFKLVSRKPLPLVPD